MLLRWILLGLMSVYIFSAKAETPYSHEHSHQDSDVMAMMPKINRSKIPVGFSGTDQILLEKTSEKPKVGDGDGQFRIACDYSHMNFDDPIVYFDQKGASHLHMYFGNTDVNYLTTVEKIANTGKSTCFGGIVNRSGYWVPAMIDTKNGSPAIPYDIVVYYKTGYTVPKRFITTPPSGLKIIAGNHKNSDENGNLNVNFSCKSQLGDVGGHAIPDNCLSAEWLNMKIDFPQCWDGINLDSLDHKSHMAFASNDYVTENKCPATHPVAIPAITYLLRYKVKNAGETKYWRLASDMYDNNQAGGLSGHGDWFNGWDKDTMDLIVKGCLKAGLDCGSNFLPDGHAMKSHLTWEQRVNFEKSPKFIKLP